MRNLKRALSLALAAVMVIGMMVVGAGAVSYNDFTDKDEIVNEDAVSMVTELGIINGLPNGTFGPTQNIDRASFVKMVALAFNGGNEPMLPDGNKVSYSDTAGTWASAYIEYCTNLGFVAGDGTTGKFNPTAPVTVSQAAKMLLVALGYNADVEGYVGYDWQMNVDAAANSNAKLYAGLSGSTSANLTRDNAAQMIYNALSASMVKYEGVYDLTTGTMKPQRTSDGMKTLLEDKFGAVKVEGVVLANDYAGLNRATTDEGKTYIDVQYESGETITVADGIFKVASTPDMLGKTVTMFVKPANNNTAASRATVLGSLIVSSDNKVAELTASKTTNAKIVSYLKDENLKMVGSTQYYINYEPQTTGSGDSVANVQPAKNYKGVVMSFIDNDDDGEVDYILQTVKSFGQVSSYVTSGDGSIYVSQLNMTAEILGLDGVISLISNTDAADDVKGFEDVAKDDYVFFYEIAGTPYVEKAEYVDVTVSAKRGDDVTADGTTYAQSGLVTAVNDKSQALKAAVSLGDKVRFYLDAGNNVVYTDAVDSTTNYLFVNGSDTYNSFRDTVEVKAVFADGTSATIDVDADGGSLSLNNNDPVTNGVYTYTKNSKDVYKLTSVASRTSTAVYEVEKGYARLYDAAGQTGTYIGLANSSTIFVVKRSGSSSYSVYTGINNVPDLEKTGGKITSYAVLDDDKVVEVMFVTDAKIGGDAEGIYVLDADPYVTGSSDDETYTYDVIYKGEKTTLTGDDDNLFSNGEGYYSDVTVNGSEISDVNTAAAKFSTGTKATTAGKDVVAADGQGTYTYDKDTIFLLVDGTDVTTVSVGAIVISLNQPSITDNIVIADTDGNGTADYVFICR